MEGYRHDGHNAMTIARWPSASGAKNEDNSKIKMCLWKGEKTLLEKQKNAGDQHFLHFPQCFHRLSFSGSLIQDCVTKG